MNAMQSWWYLLLIPMAFGISVVYRSLRETSYATYWRSVLIMTIQVVVGITMLSVAIGVFVQWVIPLINSP
ncbi:MAG TPA: hypothetical protein EYM64_01065 [Phycisphaerales bacterium]|jgi:hypothetical protein|nr:hypothetical protein [Phycisphaerales bacterium]